MSEKSLVIFHVGPVQDFIATARRSRDLWFGSWLLSELSKATALEIAIQSGNDISCLIFPAPRNLDELRSEDFNVANKVVALVTKQPEELGKSVQEAVLKRLREIYNYAYRKIAVNFDRKVAEQQVEDMIEFFWVACPVSGSYSQARDQAEALMAARKVTRDFRPVTWGSPSPKSSLDGQRESVIPEAAYPSRSMKGNARTALLRELRVNFGIQSEGERLCGVGLLKRLGERGTGSERFCSTSHLAALPLLEILADQDAANVYIKTLKRLGVSSDEFGYMKTSHPVFGRNSAHLLFEGRLSEAFDDDDKLKQAKAALQDFLSKAFNNNRPIPYYALLHADGDHIGKAINEQKTAEQHRTLSQHLSRFAGRVADIVEKNKGSLVYSGGDDVLAFMPLHTVLACARCLAEAFQREFASFKLKEKGQEISPTLSVGIVVAHHLDPLSDALTLARAAEKAAKSVKGKNALAVTVSKRSGAERTVSGTWGTLDQRLEQFIALHRTEAIPDGAAYELRDVAKRLGFSDEAMRKEAMRILRRKEAQRGLHPIAEEVLQELNKLINQHQVPVQVLAEELITAREFAKALDLANAPLLDKDVKKT